MTSHSPEEAAGQPAAVLPPIAVVEHAVEHLRPDPLVADAGPGVGDVAVGGRPLPLRPANRAAVSGGRG